jgi:phage regulator Rha-like protein
MNALVELHHAEPMTTSLIVAEGVEMGHKSVIQLLRHHVEHLEDFGPVAFEMRKGAPLPQGGRGASTEFAWLNEGQSLFLLTLMRNSPVVVEFKKALIRAFLELRARAQAAAVPSREEPLTLSHRADVMVAADRTFRAAWRTGRAAGLPTARAIRTANRIALEKTGVNLLAELDADDIALDPAPEAVAPDPWGVEAFVLAWVAGELPVPVTPCRSSDLYRAYVRWCAATARAPATIRQFVPAWPPAPRLQRVIGARLPGAHGCESARIVVPPGARAAVQDGAWGAYLAVAVARFAAALAQWEAEVSAQ